VKERLQFSFTNIDQVINLNH